MARIMQLEPSQVRKYNSRGMLPVHTAARFGHAECLRVLAGSGVRLDTPDKVGGLHSWRVVFEVEPITDG